MDPIVRSIVTEIAMSFVMPLITAAASYLVGWVLWTWQKLFKTEWDAKSREALHDAFARGMLVAVQAQLAKRGHSIITSLNRDEVLADAAAYVQKWNGGTVRKFKLSDADLRELAMSHLPQR